MRKRYQIAALVLTAAMSLTLLAGCGSSNANTSQSTDPAPAEGTGTSVSSDALVITEQGMFSAGGTVTTSDGTFDVSNYYTSREGSTSHVDHANVLYQIPENDTGLPMVFLHGYGQSRMGWMTTPGRPGGLVRPVFENGPQRVADRPAPPGRGWSDLRGRHYDRRALRPDLVHPVPHRHLPE